jgi:WD40 repeat protein
VKKFLATILLVCLVLAAKAQTPLWTRFGTEQNVRDIAASKNGLIAFITRDEIRTFRQTDFSQVGARNTTFLQEKVEITPDGSLIAVIDNTSVRFYNSTSLVPVTFVDLAADGAPEDITFSRVNASSPTYMVVRHFGAITKWRLTSGVWSKQFKWSTSSIHVEVAPNGAEMAVLGGNEVRIFNFVTPSATELRSFFSNGLTLSYAPNSGTLAVGTGTGVDLYNPATGGLIRTLGDGLNLEKVAFAPNGVAVWAVSDGGLNRSYYCSTAGSLLMSSSSFDYDPIVPVVTPSNQLVRGGSSVLPIVMRTDGQYTFLCGEGTSATVVALENDTRVFSHGARGILWQWAPQTGQPLSLDTTYGELERLAANSTENRVVAQFDKVNGRVINLYDTALTRVGQSQIRAVRQPDLFGVSQASVASHGRVFFHNSEQFDVLSVMKLANLQPLAMFDYNGNTPTAVAFSPDGTRMAVGTNGLRIFIYRTDTFALVAQITTPADVNGLVFTRGNRRLSASLNTTTDGLAIYFRLNPPGDNWTLQTRKNVPTGEILSTMYPARDFGTYWVASPTKLFQYLGENDAVLRSFDRKNVTSVAFSGDNARVYAATSTDSDTPAGVFAFLNPNPVLVDSLALSKTSVAKGSTVILTVRGSMVAPAAGASFGIARSNTTAITGPTSVSLVGGQSQGTATYTVSATAPSGTYTLSTAGPNARAISFSVP